MTRLRAAYRLACEFGDAVGAHKVGLVAAALTFYVVFALVPTMVAFGLLASAVLSPDDVATVATTVGNNLDSVAGGGTDETVWGPLARIASTAPSIGLFTTSGVVAILVALFSASRVVVTVRQALDSIFDQTADHGGWLLRGLAAIVALVALTTLAAFAAGFLLVPRLLTEITGHPVAFGNEVMNWLITVVALVTGLKLLYQYGSHHHRRTRRPSVPWTSPGIWFGTAWIAAATSLLGYLIAWSSGTAATLLIFGSPIVLMTWLYAVFLGVLLGAELTALDRRHRP